MDNEISSADVVRSIVSGNSIEAKGAFDSLVTARVGEMINQIRPQVAASLFSGEEMAFDESDADNGLDTEGLSDGDQVQADSE